MVKRKNKSVKDIQAALLSNTGYLKAEDSAENNAEVPSVIEEDVLEKYKLLAEFDEIEVEELINQALNHFLKLKGLKLEMALKAKETK